MENKQNKVAHILGLGTSLNGFIALENKKGVTIGVNDIWQYYPAEHVVCIDHPDTFSPERKAIIQNSKPKGFWSHYTAWNISPLHLIHLLAIPPIGELNGRHHFSHNNSPYVAIQVAARMGCTEIVLWGADFTGHPKLGEPSYHEAIKRRYSELHQWLKGFGVNLYLGMDYGLLKNTLPLWTSKA